MVETIQSTVHNGFKLTVVKEDHGYQVYLKNQSSPTDAAGSSIGDKILYGPYSDQEFVLAAARRAIDTGEAW